MIEKEVPFDVEYIDLYKKPDWFLAMSPLGKVPVLDIDGTILFESAVINEYIDEVHPPRWLPEAPLARARQRAWIEVASGLTMAGYRAQMAPDRAALEEAAGTVRDLWARIAPEVEGPYFAGAEFGLVDAAVAPAALRLRWCQGITKSVDFFGAGASYAERLLGRPSVTASVPEGAEDIFRSYLQGGGSPSRREAPVFLGTLISAE